MEEEGKDLTIIGKPTVQNEDAKFYKDVYVFGKLYYDFDGDDNQFGDLNVLGNAIFNGISTFKGAVNFDNELKWNKGKHSLRAYHGKYNQTDEGSTRLSSGAVLYTNETNIERNHNTS